MKKKKKNKNQPQLRKKNSQSRFFNLSPEAKKSIWGVIFAFVGIFFVFSLLGIGGEAGNSLSKVLYLFFGNGAWLIAIIFFAIGIIFFLSERPSPYPSTITGGILFFIAIFLYWNCVQKTQAGFRKNTYFFASKVFWRPRFLCFFYCSAVNFYFSFV